MGTGHGSTLGFMRDLGPRGQPKSQYEAMRNANPNYRRGMMYQINCQRCIYAYELQRRGYDVIAKPATGLSPLTDPLQVSGPGGWTEVMKGAVVDSVGSAHAGNLQTTESNINYFMYAYGPNARAAVSVHWKGKKSGHVFMAEWTRGTDGKYKVIYMDPQTGKYVNIQTCLNNAVKKDTKIMRLDNLQPTQLILDCVEPRT